MTGLLIFGASGYSGGELIRWLLRHPAPVVGVSSDRWRGRSVSERIPEAPSEWTYRSHADLLRDAREEQIAFLATPADSSLRLAPALLSKGLRVIDLSGGFRLGPDAYPHWYGFEHTAPGWLAQAEYGLPELFAWTRNDVRLVANPGCYATAALLAVAPLLTASLVTGPLMIDGKSGTTGAGRKADEALSFSEVAENLRPYRVGKHQHTPEIEQGLERLTPDPPRVSFTPHLIPMTRGLLCSVYAVAASAATSRTVREAYEAAYADARLIRLVWDRGPETGRVRGTPYTEIYAHYDEISGVIQAGAAIDNLVKGAAGQAVQNLNRLLGLPLETGLALGKRPS